MMIYLCSSLLLHHTHSRTWCWRLGWWWCRSGWWPGTGRSPCLARTEGCWSPGCLRPGCSAGPFPAGCLCHSPATCGRGGEIWLGDAEQCWLHFFFTVAVLAVLHQHYFVLSLSWFPPRQWMETHTHVIYNTCPSEKDPTDSDLYPLFHRLCWEISAFQGTTGKRHKYAKLEDGTRTLR